MYKVLSPDNIDIAPMRSFKTLREAREALAQWTKGYSTQGYYSQTCYNGYIRHISLQHLPDYCQIIAI